MEKSLQFLGHACFFSKINDKAILMDPWLSEKPSMEGGWLPYPEIKKPDWGIFNGLNEIFVWYSHEHSDHFDENYFRELCSNLGDRLTVLLPEFLSTRFADRLRDICSNRIICLPEAHPFNIDDVTLTLEFEKPLYAEHSVAILDYENSIFINGNDSCISESFQIKNSGKKKVIYVLIKGS